MIKNTHPHDNTLPVLVFSQTFSTEPGSSTKTVKSRVCNWQNSRSFTLIITHASLAI